MSGLLNTVRDKSSRTATYDGPSLVIPCCRPHPTLAVRIQPVFKYKETSRAAVRKSRNSTSTTRSLALRRTPSPLQIPWKSQREQHRQHIERTSVFRRYSAVRFSRIDRAFFYDSPHQPARHRTRAGGVEKTHSNRSSSSPGYCQSQKYSRHRYGVCFPVYSHVEVGPRQSGLVRSLVRLDERASTTASAPAQNSAPWHPGKREMG